MRWEHVRKGIIEGEIVEERGEFVVIELSERARLGFGHRDMGGYGGSRSVYAGSGFRIEVRKSLLTPLEEEAS